MQLVYTHPNYLMVENAKNVLEVEGLRVFVKNELLTSGFGELSGIDTWPELWVQAPEDLARAKALIADFMQAEPERGQVWSCPQCGEVSEPQFTHCWQCGTPRPVGSSKPYD